MSTVPLAGLGRSIIFVRHGQSTWNVQGRVPGQGNPPLTILGVQQAEAAAVQIEEHAPVRIISSDLDRARRTAEIIGRRVGVPVEVDEALREQSVGELTGALSRTLQQVTPPLGVHLHEVRWGGGESVVDVYERVGDFFDSLADSPAGPVVIVSHGFTIQIALTYLHGGSPYDVDWATLPNGGIVTVEPSGVQVA